MSYFTLTVDLLLHLSLQQEETVYKQDTHDKASCSYAKLRQNMMVKETVEFNSK